MIKVGDTVRIVGRGLHVGETGLVVAINEQNFLPVAVKIGQRVRFFARAEVEKV